MDAKKFGEELRKLRNEKGLTVTELAKRIGYSQPFISMLENGNKGIPKPDTLNKIAAGLDVPNGTLLMMAGYIDDPFEYIQLTSNKEAKKIHVDDLHDLLTKKEKVYYKSTLLSDNDKKRTIEMLDILFDNKEGE